MLFLYHGETAVCAAKVRVTLAEKQLAWEGRVMDLQRGDQFAPDYIKLNPNSVVPTLVHEVVQDGAGKREVLTESTVINEYLDDTFDAFALMPATALGRARVHLWTKREDGIHDVINTMTSALIFRFELMKQSAEEQAKRQAAIPDPARRKKWRELLDHGLTSPVADDALIRFGRQLRDMERALANGPWLTGDMFTLADAGLISFFARMEMLHAEGVWREHFPGVGGWYTRCKARPSFEVAIGQFLTEPRRANYTRLAAPLWPDVERAFGRALTAM